MRKAAVVIMFWVSIVILGFGIMYMKSVAWYAIMRDNMKFANQEASQVGWSDQMKEEFDLSWEQIRNSKDPIVCTIREHHKIMMLVTVVIAVIMLIALDIVLEISKFVFVYFMKKRKRKKNGGRRA